MNLTSEEIARIAKLARLELAPDEADAFGRQLSSILAYVDIMNAVDTADVAPLEHVAPLANVFRDDVADACSPEERDALIAAFPEHDDDLLKVKAVFS